MKNAITSPAALFLYVADGNLTRDHQYSYTWDGENRLTRILTRLDLGQNPTEPDFGDKLLDFAYNYPGL